MAITYILTDAEIGYFLAVLKHLVKLKVNYV